MTADLNVIEFAWTFTPPDYFEERSELASGGFTFVVDQGTVLVRAELSGDYVDWQARGNELHQLLFAQFLAAQILSHKPFTLSKGPQIARLRDGGRDVFLAAECARMELTGAPADMIATDASGRVVRDTRKERIDRRRSFAQRAAAHAADPIVNAILRSYGASVNDPGNELVHLYEVREALAARFGGEVATREALKISRADWQPLGELANHAPLIQGRHRGQHPGTLREATEGELNEGRRIARAMIEAYLDHLG